MPEQEYQKLVGKKKFDTFLRFNTISVCNDTEGTNSSQSIQLELTFSTIEKNIAMLIRCWCLSRRILVQRSKGEEITNLMSCNIQ